ncbi:LysR family transcriptional regulator [Pseudoxanthomonas composti]|uniref:LysR family transcriptional regulator n=2 Tax=Pseudoxanthomonas composti TaxID=2137479 RepID=A0A4V1N0U1_9GAMM|nr:LysR family transcriptional regulator [Pseudoxanthomonas composti]
MNALEDMRLFQEVLDAGSFTAAAERLDTSKQLVSRKLMALEQRLGVRLLNRTTRKLSPTPLGLAYLERAREILAAVEEAESAISRQGARPRGTLRISAPMSFGTLHLAPLLPRFLQAYPDVQLAVDLNDRAVDLVGEGYDLALRIGQLAESTLVGRRIALTQMVTCASPDYLARHGAPAEPAALRAHACLLYGHGRRGLWSFQRDGRTLGVEVAGHLRANNGEVLCEAAVQGQGIAHLPHFLVRAGLERGALQPVLAEFAPPPLPVSVLYPQHRQTSMLVRAFVDFLMTSSLHAG